jgi:hypothetical protein
MNSPVDPLPDDVVDELLSADLDGDFDLAARDHGLAPATARALIEATPRSVERRAALAAARDAIAVAALSDDERESLLARARVPPGDDELEVRRARLARRRIATIAAAAAVIALVTALGASLASIRGGDNEDRAATERSPSESVARGGTTGEGTTPEHASGTGAADSAAPTAGAAATVYDFGAAANEGELRANVAALLPQLPLRSLADAGANTERSGELFRPPPSTATGSGPEQLTSDACVVRRAGVVGAGVPLVARGPVTYAGTPAEALVFAEEDHFRVIVLDDGGRRCELLADEVVNPGP